MEELSRLANSRCESCGGLGFTIGFLGGNALQKKYICETCFIEFRTGEKVKLLNDITVEFSHGVEIEGNTGEFGTIESIDTEQWEINEDRVVNIQYAVRLSSGNVVCVWDYELLKLDHLDGES